MTRIIGYGTLAFIFMLAACDADEPCDKGQKQVQGGCVDDDSSGGSAGTKDEGKGGKSGSSAPDASSSGSKADAGSAKPDAGAVKADAGSASECSDDSDAILDDACSTNVDCNCDAPYCAKMPGAAMGTCTVFCDPDAMDCPSGHRCFDLSTLGVEGYEPFCTKG